MTENVQIVVRVGGHIEHQIVFRSRDDARYYSHSVPAGERLPFFRSNCCPAFFANRDRLMSASSITNDELADAAARVTCVAIGQIAHCCETQTARWIAEQLAILRGDFHRQLNHQSAWPSDRSQHSNARKATMRHARESLRMSAVQRRCLRYAHCHPAWTSRDLTASLRVQCCWL